MKRRNLAATQAWALSHGYTILNNGRPRAGFATRYAVSRMPVGRDYDWARDHVASRNTLDAVVDVIRADIRRAERAVQPIA